MSTSRHLLQLSLPLIREHGFTQKTLSLSVLSLPTHAEPLSDSAVSSLFGSGNDARRTLIKYWMEDAKSQMKRQSTQSPSMKHVLRKRLEWNEDVLQYLPEAFALLASPSSGMSLDLRPAIQHAAKVADEACYVTGDQSNEMSWYTRRASLAAIYAAAALHQLTSPRTAYAFLDSLLDSSSALNTSLSEMELFGTYIFKSWRGIIKSSSIF